MKSRKGILIRFHHLRLFKSCQGGGCALLIAVAIAPLLGACAKYIVREPEVRVVASAEILETKIVVRSEGSAKWHYFDFSVPDAGSATLTLSNGARTNAPSDERVEGAEVTLNDEKVFTLKEFSQPDPLEVPLRAGENRLGVRLCVSPEECAAPGKRLAVRIDAPADKVVLTPVLSPVVLRSDPLQAQATVTGLGLPVPGANVQFEVVGLGTIVERRAVTSNSGMAKTLITGFSSGDGALRATMEDTALSDTIPVKVVVVPTITLEPRSYQVTVRTGSTTSIPIKVNLHKDKGRKLLLTIAVTPDPNGTDTPFPPGSVVASAPQGISVNATITPLTPGRYTLSATATIAETGESASATIGLKMQGPVALNLPSAIPSGIRPSSKSTVVTFRTLVLGLPKSLEVIYLDEVDKNGKVINKKVATLRDNEVPPDRLSGDGFYAGTAPISSPKENEKPVEGEKHYRLRAELSTKTVISGVVTLPITELPLKARPSKGPLLDDTKSGSQFFANEVIVAALSGVSPQQVRTIVDEVEKKLKNELVLEEQQALTIVGFIPPLNLYLVEIEKNESDEVMRQTIKAFSAYKAVEDASPNFLSEPAAPYVPTDLRFPGSPPQCDSPNHVASECQYYLQTIRADDAWTWLKDRDPGATLGSDAVKVAVIDNGIEDDPTPPDLDGQVVGGNNPCASVTVACGGHGTAVAGLIAAKHNDQAIAGVAPNTKLFPYPSNGFWDDYQSFVDAVADEVKIINYSRQPDSGSTAMETAICRTISSNRLMVASAGNRSPCYHGDVYPALYNQGGLDCSGIDASEGLLAVGATDLDMESGGEGDTEIDCRGASDDCELVTDANEDDDDDNDGTLDINEDTDDYGVNNDGVIAGHMEIEINNIPKIHCSNAQPWVDMYAPGEEIVTTHRNGQLTSPSGTSYATALVSGSAAVLWAAYPDWTAQDVEACLRTRGHPLDLIPQVHPQLIGKTEDEIQERVGTDPRVLDLYSAVNHAPTDISLENDAVPENFAGAVVGTLRADDHCVSIATSMDATKPDGVTFSVNDPRFEIDGRQLKLRSGNALDYPRDCTILGADCTLSLTITATDAEGLDYGEDFVINVIEQENMCWPPHRGVPFNPNPPTIDGKVQEDVGWRGAHRFTYGDGTEPANLAFQGLKQNDDTYLYLSFEVKNDDTFDNDDLVVINFRKSASGGTAADDRRIFIYPLCDTDGAAGPSCSLTTPNDKVDRPPRVIQVWKNSASWTLLSGLPTNLDVKVRSHPDGSSKAWYVELKVPTSVTGGGAEWIDFADDFLFYFNVIRVSGGSAVEFHWPRNAPEISGSVETYPFAPQEWGLGSKRNSATCKGLSLTWRDIGTTNTPSSLIKFDDPQITSPNTYINTFVATVHNDTEIGGVPQSASQIRVRFRIANWGIPELGDWADVPAANPGCPDTNDESNPTCPSDVPAANTGGPGTHTFNLKWIVPDLDIPKYQANEHQCILAEVDSLSGANIVTKSVYRNMDFVSASKFERRATIAAKSYGPPPLGMTRHRFDLHVTTRELAIKVEEEKESTDQEGRQVSKLLWVVNGYRRTGRFIIINENRYAIMDPVGSFGYVVTHVGKAVKSWKQGLHGAEKVANNLYRLSLRPGEAAHVTTLAEPKGRRTICEILRQWLNNLKRAFFGNSKEIKKDEKQ